MKRVEDDWVRSHYDLGFFCYASVPRLSPFKRIPTIDSIAEGLRKMARLEASELAAMGARARRIIQEFGWDRPAQILSQAYHVATEKNTGCGVF